jgi:hypothetical protein
MNEITTWPFGLFCLGWGKREISQLIPRIYLFLRIRLHGCSFFHKCQIWEGDQGKFLLCREMPNADNEVVLPNQCPAFDVQQGKEEENIVTEREGD